MIYLLDDDISYNRDNISISKSPECFDNICGYVIKVKKPSVNKIKDEQFSYEIEVKSYNLLKAKQNISSQERYEMELFAVLQKYRISSLLDMDKLNDNDRVLLFEEIEQIKEKVFKNEFSQKDDRASALKNGDVLLTVDGTRYKTNHGHAGIVNGSNGAVIEANPGDGVKNYTNGINYWRNKTKKTTKRYTIKGATQTQKNKAKDVAKSKIGKKYCLNPLGDSCYFCTKLVWTAWDYSGAKNKIGHYYFAPDMMRSSSLQLLKTMRK